MNILAIIALTPVAFLALFVAVVLVGFIGICIREIFPFALGLFILLLPVALVIKALQFLLF